MVIRKPKAASTSVLVTSADPPEALSALCDELYRRLAEIENRRRARKAADEVRYKASLLAFVRAIATIALSQVPPFEGVYVSFTGWHYTGSGLSGRHLKSIREGLDALELIVIGGHWNDPDPEKSFTTRIRHTGEFAALARSFGLKLSDLILPPIDVIAPLSDPEPDAGEMPADVAASASILYAYNEFIRGFELSLPWADWVELERRVANSSRKEDKLRHGYNDHRIYLTRRFAENWDRGGRLYDGFYQNMPKVFRARLLIDGEPTVELDFSRIHPAIIFAEKSIPFDIDPYDCPGFPGMIEAGKEMFQRLLNSREEIKYRPEDHDTFPTYAKFCEFRYAMVEHLSPISDVLQKDYGTRLQKRDSELALHIIDRCMSETIPVYPVHDSFITTESCANKLRTIMDEEFRKMFGVSCTIK